MASQSEEKDLIGSILSDQDDKQDIIPKKARKNLSLKSKEFDPQIHSKHQEFQTSNASILSTGYQSQQKQRIFFQTQTSIEIQSQLSSALQQTADQDTIRKRVYSLFLYKFVIYKKINININLLQQYLFI